MFMKQLHRLPATPNDYNKQTRAIAGNAGKAARTTADLAQRLVNPAANTTRHYP
jgi:hypothetical protein